MNTSIVTGSMLSLASRVSPMMASFRQDRFQKLVVDLKQALGPSSGLTCDDVDIPFLTRLMADYDGSDNKWSKYAFGDASQGYTRNLVDDGNGKSNLVRPVQIDSIGRSTN